MMIMIIIIIIIKSPFNSFKVVFGTTFCKYFFVFCPALLSKDASRRWHALTSGSESIRMNYKALLDFKG